MQTVWPQGRVGERVRVVGGLSLQVQLVTQRQSVTADRPPASQHPLRCGCHGDALLVVTSSRERETLPRFPPLKKAR